MVSVTQTRVMIRQSELMDRQARASVRPILEIGIDRSYNIKARKIEAFAFVLENNGVGPATIDEVLVSYAGKPIAHWGALFDAIQVADSVPRYTNNAGINQTVFQAGTKLAFLDLSTNPALGQVINEHANKISFTILYRSLYDDRYHYVWEGGESTNAKFDPRKDAVVGVSFAD